MSDTQGRYRIGVDVGGTFTDAAVFDDAAGSLRCAKAPSTPADPARAVLDVLERLGVDLGEVQRFIHGITIGTNAVLEGRGAEVWMLTTAGFRDVLEIARTNRTVLYDITALKPPPLVPRGRTLEIDERMAFDGSVLRPLDLDQARAAVDSLPPGAAARCASCTATPTRTTNGRWPRSCARCGRPSSAPRSRPSFCEFDDFSCALFGSGGEMVAQSWDHPGHVLPLPWGVRCMFEDFADDLHPGDVVLLNDPYRGGTHLNDVTLIHPIFDEDGNILVFPAVRTHWVDVGGMVPGSYSDPSTNIYQEGVRIPPIKILERGRSTAPPLPCSWPTCGSPRCTRQAGRKDSTAQEPNGETTSAGP